MKIYDCLLLIFLQGSKGLKRKKDERLSLQARMDTVAAESVQKNKIEANDSKLIMQLSKKLVSLLMDNEALRNERLNTRYWYIV